MVDDGADEGEPGPGEPGPERSSGARPFRVVGFDDLGDTEGERPVRVAAFGDLDGAGAPHSPPRVASLDLARRRRRTVEDLPPSAAEPQADAAPAVAAGPVDRRVRRSAPARTADANDGAVAAAPVTEPSKVPSDDLPPDGPLPRGRRRRARVGRLGPDGPDPEVPEPPADPVAIAREICLRLLTDRARTRQELAQALARKGVPGEAAAAVLDRFDEVGLIDDTAFAAQWVRSRHDHRGLGRRAIAVELRRKGVADDVARAALAGVDTAAEARRARELVDRKLRSLRVDTPEERARAANRLVGMLARRGYGAGVAYGAVRDALAAHGAGVEELGDEPPG